MVGRWVSRSSQFGRKRLTGVEVCVLVREGSQGVRREGLIGRLRRFTVDQKNFAVWLMFLTWQRKIRPQGRDQNNNAVL